MSDDTKPQTNPVLIDAIFREICLSLKSNHHVSQKVIAIEIRMECSNLSKVLSRKMLLPVSCFQNVHAFFLSDTLLPFRSQIIAVIEEQCETNGYFLAIKRMRSMDYPERIRYLFSQQIAVDYQKERLMCTQLILHLREHLSSLLAAAPVRSEGNRLIDNSDVLFRSGENCMTVAELARELEIPEYDILIVGRYLIDRRVIQSVIILSPKGWREHRTIRACEILGSYAKSIAIVRLTDDYLSKIHHDLSYPLAEGIPMQIETVRFDLLKSSARSIAEALYTFLFPASE